MMNVLIKTSLILCAVLALSSCKVEKFHLVKADDLQRTENIPSKLKKERSPSTIVVVNIDDRDTLSNTLILYKSDVKDGLITGEPSPTEVNPKIEYYLESMEKMNIPFNLKRIMDIRKEDKRLPLNHMYVFVADSSFQHVRSHSELHTMDIQNAERVKVGPNEFFRRLLRQLLWALLILLGVVLIFLLIVVLSGSSFWG